LDGGFSVDVAVTGRTAIEMFASRHYDAVTLDLLLPDMSGLDVVSAFRESGHNADVPIIVVTVVTESAAAGLVVNDILSKPLDSEGLLTALSRAGISGEKYGRVLVIDDDAGSVKLMAEALVRLGYEPACFSRAEDALAAVSERPAVAVVLDLLMPGMDGLEFLHRFRENADNRQVPVLVWTVKDLTRDDVKRLTSWAATVLPKAQGSVDLAGALRGHLGTPFPDLAR
jgi:DNA-binding response OmpR family regulator